LKGKRKITGDTALRLSKYFGNSPKFWLGLQDDYDLETERSAKKNSPQFDKGFPIERRIKKGMPPILVASNSKHH
jgi:plasmid maintenance system antidote protein VapI